MAIRIRVTSAESRIQLVRTRMPFRYGAAELVRCPHLYLIAQIQDEQGRWSHGIAADNLPPLWFDKSPEKSYAQQLEEQLKVIGWASEAALAEGYATPFRLWLSVYRSTSAQAVRQGLPGLLAGFGPSLIERAVNDAVGRLLNIPFHQMMRSDALGVDLTEIDRSLSGISSEALLPAQPLQQIQARHTVGLSDPLKAADIPEAERINDGLPQSLEEVIPSYGIHYFKIKIQNRLEVDLDRLRRIAAVIDERLPEGTITCTLDGNEQYHSVAELQPLLHELEHRSELRRLWSSIAFVEQPLARSSAMEASGLQGIDAIPVRVIIDESEDSLESYAEALRLGYSGVSHKNCKGTFKTLLNMARNRSLPDRSTLLSGEDLTNIGVIALNQDLAALASLGIAHAERNGHHYFRGLCHLSSEEQDAAAETCPDLYMRSDSGARLRIEAGAISCRSINGFAGLGSPLWPQVEAMKSLEEFDVRGEFPEL